MTRTTEEVFADHLRLRAAGDLETDLQRNFAEDVVLLCSRGAFRGRDAVRDSGQRLQSEVPDGRYEFVCRQVAADYAFLEWRVDSSEASIDDGADSFMIKDGLIRFQSIHYTPKPK